MTTANTPRTNDKIICLSHSKQRKLNSNNKMVSSEKYFKSIEAVTQVIDGDQKNLEETKNTVHIKKNNELPKKSYYDFNTHNKQATSFIYSPNNLKMEPSSASYTNKVR